VLHCASLLGAALSMDYVCKASSDVLGDSAGAYEKSLTSSQSMIISKMHKLLDRLNFMETLLVASQSAELKWKHS
jgi:hypothetical protein